ncbi:ABC transporter permease subunit [Thermopolyspora sp. NPDC052614]|uniref:ABC transporter permease n=1 Tax=Thermopolyspora sp. NPDC052614 TaxID=3155682 RepID=UPI00344A4E8E
MGRSLAPLWPIPVIVVCWEVATRLAVNQYFPPPSQIAIQVYELWFSGPPSHLFLTEDVSTHIWPSLGRLLRAWFLACLVGVVIGVALGRSRRLADYIDPLIQFGRAIPPPTLLPLFLALFKVGPQMQIATIIFGIIWPVLLNSIEGARHIDLLHLETAAVFKISPWRRLVRIILPEAAPKIFAGLRVSLSLALILMVISEMIGGTEGIGFSLVYAGNDFDFPGMWAWLLLLGILGLIFNSILIGTERRVLSWHHRERQST